MSTINATCKVIDGKLYISRTPAPVEAKVDELAAPEPKAAEQPAPEPEAPAPEAPKFYTPYDKEIEDEVNSAVELTDEELDELHDKVYKAYMELNPTGTYNSPILKDRTFYKNNYSKMMTKNQKYSILANYHLHLINDSTLAKRFCLLAIKYGNEFAMNNYACEFYFNTDFEKSRKLIIMALRKNSSGNALSNFKTLFKNNKKNVNEYRAALCECENSNIAKNEIERIDKLINGEIEY